MLNDRILVELEADGERRSSGGILIPATAQMGKRLAWGQVVATGPNRIIGCEGTPRTTAALRGAGVTLTAVEVGEFVRWHGGPHCLTLPLERG